MGNAAKRTGVPAAQPAKPPFYRAGWFEALVILGVAALAICAGRTLTGWNHPGEMGLIQQILNGLDLNALERLGLFPLYPLLLAGWLKLGSLLPVDMEHPVRDFHLLLYAAAVVLAYRYSAHHLDRPWRYVVAGMFALSPSVLLSGGGRMLAFFAFSLGAMGVVGRFFVKGGRMAVVAGQHIPVPDTPTLPVGKKLVAGAFLVLGALTHPAGYVLLAAMVPVAVRRLRLQGGLLMMGGTVFALLPVWILLLAGGALEIPAFRFAPPGIGHLQTMGADAASRMFGNVPGPFPLAPADIVWMQWLSLALVVLGLGLGLKKRTGLGGIYLLLYLLLLALFSIQPAGLDLLPVLPLLLLYFFSGLAAVGRLSAKIRLPVGKVAGPVLVGLMLLGMVVPYQRTLLPEKTVKPKTGFPSSVQPVEAWLKANVPGHAKIYVPRPVPATRRALALDKSNRLEDRRQSLWHQLAASDFVVEDTTGTSADVSALIRRFQKRFRLVYNNSAEQIRVWEVRH